MVGFEHEALLYEGAEGFVRGVAPFVRAGIDAGEPVMVAVRGDRAARLRGALGRAAQEVEFVDMGELGRNPGRIIPAWHAFLDEHGAAPVRGVGEPVWPGRSPEELLEAQLHEALLNLAFADAEGFRLLCPYDRSALGGAVLHEACRSHTHVRTPDDDRVPGGVAEADLLAPFDAPLAPPRAAAEVLAYDHRNLSDVRATVAARALAAGLTGEREVDLVFAVHEIAANSVRHGGGHGVLRVWEEGGALVCELRDRGRIDDPLVGRRRPAPEDEGGWGVYLAHQVCDLVQLRSGAGGTVVRLHVRAS